VSEPRTNNPNWQDVLSSHKEEYAAIAREGYIQRGAAWLLSVCIKPYTTTLKQSGPSRQHT
jgi:hypothetical protein